MVYGGYAVNYIKIMDISQSELKERFVYDPLTGKLSWSHSSKVWAAARGKEITHIDKKTGYIHLTLTHNGKRKSYSGHRIIWKLMTGETPEVIDHKNRKRADNRWVNLRNTNSKSNAQNRTPSDLFCKLWHNLNKTKMAMNNKYKGFF